MTAMNISDPIIVEQEFALPAQNVWSILTRHEFMIEWFFEDIPSFKAEMGFKTSFPVVSGDKTFTHLWEITEVDPHRKIVYDWRYAEYEGVGKITFEVFEQDQGCLVRVMNEGLETFPQEIPEFKPESCKAGWEYFIQGRLKEYLEG